MNPKKIKWNVSTKGIWKGKDIPEEQKNKLLQLEEFKGAEELPDEVVYFEGVVSNGEENRNGYTIESNAWFFDKSKYVNDFLATGSVLDNHNDDKPIGRPLAFELNGDDVNVAGYVWDDLAGNKIGRKLVLGLSTGHITHESVYENTDTKARIDGKDFWDMMWHDSKMWDEYWNGVWKWIVTKAEIVEYSFVPTRSNRGATLTNGIGADQENFGIQIPKNTTKEQAKILFFNKFAMKYKKNADGTDMLDPTTGEPIPEDEGNGGDSANDGADGKVDETTPPTTDPATPSEEPTTENSIKLNGMVVETNELQKLTNFIIKEVEKNFTSKIEGLEEKNKTLSNDLQEVQTSLNTLKDAKRDGLTALVPNGTDGKQEGEKTIASIIKEKNELNNSNK